MREKIDFCKDWFFHKGDINYAEPVNKSDRYPDLKLLSVESASDMTRFGTDWTYRENSYFTNLTEIAGDYTGGAATKYNQTDVSVTLDLSQDDLTELREKYNAVKINLMLFHGSATTSSVVGFTNFALVTHTQDTWYFNTWYEITISIDAVIAAMENNSLALVVGAAKNGLTPTFCFGDIVLTNA